ncbi:MAG TPA: carboxypeptidase regulatory-like domain-containing protein [Candidatus Acidoferrum sp.]|nr:carboxypeptidase regulatory-like domain-containing protein [Candidatus Acidoferrum sp.]
MFTTQSKTTQNKFGQNNSGTKFFSKKGHAITRTARRSVLHLIVIAALGAFALAQAPAQNPARQAQNGSAQKSPSASRGSGRGNVFSAQSSASSEPHRLPLRRVVLYKSGVGYFEHTGQVNGNEDLEIDLTSSQLNDVLKSLTALDLNGGRIVGASYNSQEPAGHQLESLPIPVANKTNLSDLLQALRGARIEVRNASGAYTGRVLGVEKMLRQEGEKQVSVERVNLIGENGEVRQILLEQGTSVRFVDREMEKQLERAMGLLDASHQEDTRRLILSTAGAGERTVRVSYISEVPVWKMTYRIVLPERADRKPLLQGWAVVDNTVGEDWENVELSLASGAPQSFIQNLSQPLYTRRPVVGLPQAYQLTPQLHAATLVPGNGGLTVIVTDPDGKAVAGANVRMTDSSGKQVVAGVSGRDGRISWGNMASGRYDVLITAPNFKTMKMESVEVVAARVYDLTAKMQIGAVTMETTVSAGGQEILETLNSSIQTTGGPRNTVFEGLPKVGVNVTFDGINVTDKQLTSSCGFFAALDAGAMRQSMNAGTGMLLGDMFEYRARDRVTIRKNQSALVPIAQTEMEAEKVTLWNASMGTARPLRALWVKNTSDFVLDSGTFNVIEDNTFAGEGLMAILHPGERRLISYAADLGLQVVPKQEPDTPKITHVKVAGGELVRTVEQRQKTIYTIRNEDAQTRTVVIEHPIRADWTLSEEMNPAEKTADLYRLRVKVASKETKEFNVEETHPEDSGMDLNKFGQDDLEALAKDHALTPELEKALKDLIAKGDSIGEMDEKINSKHEDENNLVTDQGRLRQNLEALKGTSEEKALVQRYTKELNDEEDKLAALRKEIADLEAKKKQAEVDLQKFIEKMSFDVKL